MTLLFWAVIQPRGSQNTNHWLSAGAGAGRCMDEAGARAVTHACIGPCIGPCIENGPKIPFSCTVRELLLWL